MALRSTALTPLRRALLLLSRASRRHASTNPFFALPSLSNSRETQHFNKITKLSRIEHSPTLKLIQSSEVDPFPLPEPVTREAILTLRVEPGRDTRARSTALDKKAVAVGKAVLSQQARRMTYLQRGLARSLRRENLKSVQLAQAQRGWQDRERKMRADMRIAGVWILASVGTATGLAMWRFWPEARAAGKVDSGELGRKIARKAREAMPVPAVTSGMRAARTADKAAVAPATVKTAPAAATMAAARTPVAEAKLEQAKRWSWSGAVKSLLWKQA
ncbi:hypothetical protein B0A48_05681 [Cryoendolithus antarcticus]|uniref:Uncharacterized protein n=1 Tax=Cryoendolithus antarcticus TaxID=1507870 RepID=A0A1V8TC16_9PEZI|nr:hypothetical protein B0A48_05681 [Cryoendolithus antarcticus]